MTISSRQNPTDLYDLLIIGGGINGAGIARDAAGRGLRVCLVEAADLASGTSSASTKLIHGGLRYLEYYEFSLVRKALKEREILMNLAPHIIWPMRFILPHAPWLRPQILIRMGLFLYDYLGGRQSLEKSRFWKRTVQNNQIFAPLKARFQSAFSYADCWVEDSRLVILNAMDAAAHGADIITYTACEALEHLDGVWQASLSDGRRIKARKIVNAAGPWAGQFMQSGKLKLVKGSHIIVPRLYDGEQAYIIQNDDKRIVFTIPYEGKFTLIGTTDIVYNGDARAVAIEEQEVQYLLDLVNQNFEAQISKADIVADFSGVRPLLDDGKDNLSAVTRDYDFRLEQGGLLQILGGKLTTYRLLACEAVDKLFPQTTGQSNWTAQKKLAGGDFDKNKTFKELKEKFNVKDEKSLRRLIRAYGGRTEQILQAAAQSGEHLDSAPWPCGLTRAELDYLIAHEFARTGDDVLRRRSKLIYHLDIKAQKSVTDYIKNKIGDTAHG